MILYHHLPFFNLSPTDIHTLLKFLIIFCGNCFECNSYEWSCDL